MIRIFVRAVVRSRATARQKSVISPQLISKAVPRSAVGSETQRCYSTPSSKVDDMLTSYISADHQKEPQDDLSDVEAELSPSELQRFKVMQLEFDVQESMGETMPVMNAERWRYVLKHCHSRTKRKSQYKYWMKTDFKIKKAKEKKAVRYQAHLEREAEIEQSKKDGTYDPQQRIMQKLLKGTMNEICYHNLAHSMVHGIPLVYDFGYNDKMNLKEIKRVTKQVLSAHGWNKYERDPFHVHWTSCPQDSYMLTHAKRAVGMDLETIPFTITEKSYLDLFPEKDIVYLSPHSPNVLKEFNPHDVYVIGSLVDLSSQGPLSYAKAKRQRIRSAKLPLDHHITWGMGSKSLTLDQMMLIMLSMKESPRDWRRAFEIAIPKRKLLKDHDY